MAKLEVGMTFPRFRYDTPYKPQNSFWGLLGHGPLFVIFLSNLGHPVTRTQLTDYIETFGELQGGSLACVVRSSPAVIAAAIPEDTLPFPLICDAVGALYQYFEIPQETNPLKYSSLKSISIMREAGRQGYHPPKDKPQQLPLTALLNEKGEAVFVHYGKSLTDLPEDCAALTTILEKYRQSQPEALNEPDESYTTESFFGGGSSV